MRLWSIHPRYLDSKGLVALWRESLLAQNVLWDKTKGYKNHPQLNRFKGYDNPKQAIADYLWEIARYAHFNRDYNFNVLKILLEKSNKWEYISITKGQLEFEFKHLQKKLMIRDLDRYWENEDITRDHGYFVHMIFKESNHDNIEPWEIINEN